MSDKPVYPNENIPSKATDFEEALKGLFQKSFDIVISKLDTRHKQAVIVFVEGMVDKDIMDRDIIKPLKSGEFTGRVKAAVKCGFKELHTMSEVIKSVLSGLIILYYEGSKSVLAIDLIKWKERAVEEPDAENVIRGPREGFVENVYTNVMLLRRKLKTHNLIVEKRVLGRQSNTSIAIAYLDNIVNKKVLDEVKKRLEKIDVDAILESSHLEQYLEENPLSIMSGIGLTQKPDVAAIKLLDGRVVVLCDGSPHALTIPELFMDSLKNSGDYYNRTIYGNFLRALRIVALIISILLPGFTAAVLSFHHEMVPLIFLTTIIQAKEGTPFPTLIELLFLMFMFEIIKEAGLRLPKSIGSAITIVGALILGDIAVSAGLVGALSVIIVALTAVASLAIMSLNEFITFYRIVLLLMGGSMGIVGLSAGLLIMLTQIISNQSFGIPLLSSFNKVNKKDNMLRFPLSLIKRRSITVVNNKTKIGEVVNYKGDFNV
jgi:spore germination protein KA